LARAVDVGDDRVLGDAEPPRDLLGREVPVDQQQALAFARRERLDQVFRLCPAPAHEPEVAPGYC
jgi:hypothetical protein